LVVLAAAGLAFANRDNVTFKLVPSWEATPLHAGHALYLLVFSVFLFCVVIGAATIGLRQMRKRTQNASRCQGLPKSAWL